jgi:hypothetical protein
MSHSFSRVPSAEIPRSSFDRSHGYKTTLDSGLLVPFFCDEVLPGDTFNLTMTGFARLSTPMHPVMDNAYFNTFFFFVPNRLLWSNWEKFNGQQDNPGDSTDFLVPQVSDPLGFDVGSMGDYFGLPTGVPGLAVNALYFRAYNLIYNDWFRDENLIDSIPVPKGDGPDLAVEYPLQRRGKRHDYFTSCLPWPQKGESVTIPLGQTAPVRSNADFLGVGNFNGVPTFNPGNISPTPRPITTDAASGGGSVSPLRMWTTDPGAANVYWDDPALMADLSQATAATINQLRQAFQIQKLYERDARGGTRYTEIVRSHFGVVSPDARLQRPEYLGGGQSPVLVSQVPQTSASGDTSSTPQGNLAAFGTSTMHGHGFSKAFTEHGVILGIVCVRADLTYQRGLNRMFSRRGRFDYFWPALSHIGEQAVLSKEIYCDGTAGDEDVFGYQERYAEYRYKNSKITGQFRSTFPQSLDSWHLSQDFETRPLLNKIFIEENPPIPRIVAVQNEPQFIADFYFNLRCARPMPVYGVPGLIDHF